MRVKVLENLGSNECLPMAKAGSTRDTSSECAVNLIGRGLAELMEDKPSAPSKPEPDPEKPKRRGRPPKSETQSSDKETS